jgi:hypothetical protein
MDPAAKVWIENRESRIENRESRKDDPTMATKKANKAETPSILDYFAELPDPRRDNQNKRRKFNAIIAIAILAFKALPPRWKLKKP